MGGVGDVYLPKNKFQGSGDRNSLTPCVNGEALPLVLIKPFNSENKMQINYAPISLSDIPKTVTSQLGLRDGFSGTSVFEIKESDKRIRRYFSYDWEEQDIKDNFLPIMTEYVVSGFSWLEESWHATGRKLTCPKRVIYQPNIIWRRIKKLILE